jgi:hypothetical protein
MRRLGAITGGIVIATLLCLAAPQAEAIERYGLAAAATQLNDGPVIVVRTGRGGGARHGGVHRGSGVHNGMNRGGYNRGAYAHRGNFHGANRYANRSIYRNGNRNAHRNVNRNVYRAGAWGAWTRPSGYSWPAGGAVAAGAALGFVSAAAAASWAGAAPGPNLCWYYTDPSRQQGFWDACP